LALAGLLTGLSALVKVSGLFGLFPLALAAVSRPFGDRAMPSTMDRVANVTAPWTGLVGAALVLAGLWTPNRLVVLAAPIAVVCVVAWTRRCQPQPGAATALAMVTAGVAVPALVMQVGTTAIGEPWVLADYLATVRSAYPAAVDIDVPSLTGGVLVLALGTAWMLLSRITTTRVTSLIAAASFLGLVLVTGELAVSVWTAIGTWLPAAVAIGVLLGVDRRDRTMLTLGAFAVILGLFQVPAFNQYYLLYIAPLAVLILVGVAGDRRVAALMAVGAVAVMGVALKLTGQLYSGSDTPGATQAYISRDVGRLDVMTAQSALDVVLLLECITQNEPLRVLATPDAVEVPYLSGSVPLDDVLFEFLSGPGAAIAERAAQAGAEVVVLKHGPSFSEAPTAAEVRTLETSYEMVATFGRYVLYAEPSVRPRLDQSPACR